MREELEKYVQRAEEIIEESPQMGEANTKNMLVRPFIEALGWEFYPSEIELEYSVRMASRQTKVDYALMLDKAPSVFVEAKGLDTQLADKHRKQITSYMHNEKGVEWGLLTNGKEYEFYRYDRTPSGQTLGKIPLEQLPRDFEIVKTLSKKSVEAGESEQIAERIRARKHAVSTLKADKDAIAKVVTEVVTDRIGDSLSTIVETEAKELVDSIVNEIEKDVEKSDHTERKNIKNKKEDEYDIKIMKKGELVKEINDQSQADGMADAVKYLIENMDLLDKLSIPYVPGRKKAIINDKEYHPNGEKMRMYREIKNEYFLDTHMSKKTKERHLGRLAKMCGVELDFGW